MPIVSRRTLLAFSVVTSLALHSLLLAAAPNIPLLARTRTPEHLLQTFRVRLVDDAGLQRVEAATDGAGQGLGTRPGSITDLLKDELQAFTPENSLIHQTVPVPQLAERLGKEAQDQAPDTAVNEEVIKRVDAKIVEISEAIARQDIQVTRRLVAPSSTRIIGEGEFPTLRGDGEKSPEKALLIEPLPSVSVLPAPGASGGNAPVAGRSGEAGTPAPAWEPIDDTSAGQDLPELPELPIEKMVASRPVSEEIRKDSKSEFFDDLVSMQLDAYVPAGEREGFFRLRIVPKEGETIGPLPKDVTFIIDASNSILQRKLDQTTAGVRTCIAGLRPDDRFNVVIFRDTPTLFRTSLTYATPEERQAASEFLSGVVSRGETDVYQGILPVIAESHRPGVPGIVLVISDGKPTTGIRDGRTLINALTKQNNEQYSIYTFAGGRTVNQHLLDLLAYRNKGEASFTSQLEAIGKELPQFFSALGDPILVACAADFGRINEEGVFPKQIPDFYKGQAVTIYGRFDPTRDREFAMRLTGQAGSKQKEVVFRADLTKASRGDKDIARNWAFRKIYYLIGEMTRAGETPELLAEVRALARQYGIRTSYDE